MNEAEQVLNFEVKFVRTIEYEINVHNLIKPKENNNTNNGTFGGENE